MKEKPRFLYRGVTVNYKLLKTFEFVGVQIKPRNDYDRIENGRKIRSDGNEYGVYMSDNIEVANCGYGFVGENSGSILSNEITFSCPARYVIVPSVGLTYEIDTSNIDARIPYINPQWKGHYNNGFEGDEWITDSIPSQAYSIVSATIAPDVLHDKEEIEFEDDSQIGDIVKQKIEERKQRLERFLQELKKMTPSQRWSIAPTDIKMFRALFGENGVAYIQPDEIEITDCADGIKYLFSSIYDKSISNPDYSKLRYINSLEERLSGDIHNRNINNIIMLIKKDLNDIDTQYNAYLTSHPQESRVQGFELKKERLTDVLNTITEKKDLDHKAVISKVEATLSFKITDVAGYTPVDDPLHTTPKEIKKDKVALTSELVQILKQLTTLNYEGKLDFTSRLKMAAHVGLEYRKMIVQADEREYAEKMGQVKNTGEEAKRRK